jgi:hypothetical protein
MFTESVMSDTKIDEEDSLFVVVGDDVVGAWL